MSANQTAGTGNQTASQAATATTAPAQGQPTQPQANLQDILPQGAPEPAHQQMVQMQQPAANGGGENTDSLAALAPMTPEEAAKAAGKPDAKPGEAAPAEENSAEAPLDIKLPDGFQKDDALMRSFLDVAKEGGIKQETAQKLFDMYVGESRKVTEAVETSFFERQSRINAEWAKQCREDPEFGGANFDAGSNHVIQAVRRFLPEAKEQAEFVEFFRAANLNNNPILRRFIARVGAATAEAGPVQSEASNPAREVSIADQLYKGMNLR